MRAGSLRDPQRAPRQTEPCYCNQKKENIERIIKDPARGPRASNIDPTDLLEVRMDSKLSNQIN